MDDVVLLAAIRQALTLQLPPQWTVVQNYQPTGQARHSGPTVYMAKLGETPTGFPSRRDVWNPERQDYDHVHDQIMQARVRIQGFAPEDDPEATLYSADVAARASLALQSDAARAILREVGAAPLRIINLPAIGVQDERDAWEKVSTFDFLLSYSRAMVQRTPSATIGDLSIHAV